jgi:radical SAM protein with 4Fe4S-binding SPASM domain
MHVLPFADIKALLTMPQPNTTCVWNHCDPLTTEAVHGINPNGELSNCGRTNKDGVNWVKGDRPGYERYHALYHTPQEFGGCQGCRYFMFCKGHCPGTAIDGDWRNRTVNCRLWYGLFERIERDCDPGMAEDVRRYLEPRILAMGHADVPHGDAHADSWDHMDVPHGDEHRDHTDADRPIRVERIPVVILDHDPDEAP